jgi:glycosyltransferase involved in cell wall biosynthesis
MSKISLCLISGNVEEYIGRCLSSFAPIADEICVVRAIGNQEPDRTIEIAERLFLTEDNKGNEGSSNSGSSFPSLPSVKKFRWSEYKNAEDHKLWPHIDNFAAARQQSFDMATGDYIFWCDTDDILKSGAEFVRQHADRGSYPVYMFPYDIFGRGVDFTRERMVLRGAGKWKFPVHECFQFTNPNVQGVEDQRVVIQHLPHTSKTGSNERNLRIMESIPEDELTPGLLYHLHGELLAMPNRQQDAIEAAKKALAHPELGKPERYEIFLNLGRMAKTPEAARAFFHEAYKADPCRREALGLLTCSALDFQLYSDSLAYARQMLATTKPETESWNDRAAAYEWLGIEIYTQALRANGFRDEANRCRKNLLEQAGRPTISLIHATRGRPRQASIARKLWMDLAERPDRIEHIFVITADDKISAPLLRMHNVIVPAGDPALGEGGCVNAWNAGALNCNGDVLIQMSDDWMPPPRWDALILERMGDLEKPKVLAVSDGHRKDDLLCMAIMTKAYMIQDYFMFHPYFNGVYSDNWFTREAYRRGQVIDARDLVFTHNHPIFNSSYTYESQSENRVRGSGRGRVEFDETYARQNAPERYAEGEKIMRYLEEGRDWSSVPGWFNYWGFYRQIAKTLKDGDVVAEVGVWLGRSIIYLAQECQRLGKKIKIIAVDNFKGEIDPETGQVIPEHQKTLAECGSIYKLFEQNIERCGVAGMIETFVGDSAEEAVEVEDGSLAFCFIDAAHDYESVKRDIAAWLPKVRQGGILAGHDAEWEGVQKAIKEAFGDDVAITGTVWIHACSHRPVAGRDMETAHRAVATGAVRTQNYQWAGPNCQAVTEAETYIHSP